MKKFIDRLIELTKRLIQFTRRLFQIRWIRYSSQAILYLFIGYFLWRQVQQANNLLENVRLEPSKLILSILTYLITLFLGAIVWWLLLWSMEQRPGAEACTRVQLVSNLAKYLPGYGWQIAGKAVMTYRLNIPANIVGTAIALEFGLLIGAGLILALLFFPATLLDQWQINPNFSNALLRLLDIVAIIGFIILVSIPFLSKKIKSQSIPKIHPWPYFLAVIGMILGWFLLSYSFWALSNAFTQAPFEHYREFVFVLTTSILIGLLILIVPSGLGVRESMMVILLGGLINPSIAILIAASFRLISIACDFIGAGLIEVGYRLSKPPKKVSG